MHTRDRSNPQNPECPVWVKTQQELRSALGVRDSGFVAKAVRAGAPGKVKGKGYDVTAWRRWREENAGRRLPRTDVPQEIDAPSGNGHDPGYGHLGQKKLYEECRLAELKRQQAEGRLVDRASAIRIMSRHVNDCRVQQEDIADTVALLIADPELKELVRAEVQRIIADSHRSLAQGVNELTAMEAET